MVTGFAVLGAISASWGFAKDIVTFCKRYHDAKTEIPAAFLQFENDTILLGSLDKFFTNDVLETLDGESLDHLQRVFSYLLPILQSTHTRLLKYKSDSKWDRTKWIVVGKDLKSAEHAIHHRWWDSYGSSENGGKDFKFSEAGHAQSEELTKGLRLEDEIGNSLQPSSGGQLIGIGSKTYLVEWKRLPASEANDERIRQEAEQEIVKLVSVLSAINAAKMFSMRTTNYFVSHVEPTVPFGIVYELPVRFESPDNLLQLLEKTDNQGNRILKHSLDQRFELARQIASAILFIHSIGWVHKGVQTSNIWMANRQSSTFKYPQYLGTAFLTGFDYTRREVARSTGDETVGGGWRRQLYQHPDRAQTNSEGQVVAEFLPEYDIYAFGVVLVEIGRWKPLHRYAHLFQNVPATKRKQNLEDMADGLKITMGKRYVDVALRCLQILDGGQAPVRRGPAIRDILFDLEDLATATA